MGLSGSGKSTLLRAVNGLNKVTRGKVMVRDGSGREGGGMVDVASCDAGALRSLRMNRVAMGFPQFALLPWRPVEEHVGLGLELRGMGKAERTTVAGEKRGVGGHTRWAGKYSHTHAWGTQEKVG